MQKFKYGDLVHIDKDLGPTMQHFQCDVDAIVIGSYFEKYGYDSPNIYTVYIEGRGEVSWYDEKQLTLIATDRQEKLENWRRVEEAKEKVESDLDWIFSHPTKVLRKPSHYSLQALANCVGLTNLWGKRGEGMDYFFNSKAVLEIAKPYLERKDKDGYVNFCRAICKH